MGEGGRGLGEGWERVGEGGRGWERVGEGWERVGEGGRGWERVGEGWERVGEGWKPVGQGCWERVGCHALFLALQNPLVGPKSHPWPSKHLPKHAFFVFPTLKMGGGCPYFPLKTHPVVWGGGGGRKAHYGPQTERSAILPAPTESCGVLVTRASTHQHKKILISGTIPPPKKKHTHPLAKGTP